MSELENKRTSKHATSIYFDQKEKHSVETVTAKLCDVLDAVNYWRGEATSLARRVNLLESEIAFLRTRTVRVPIKGQVL